MVFVAQQTCSHKGLLRNINTMPIPSSQTMDYLYIAGVRFLLHCYECLSVIHLAAKAANNRANQGLEH